MDPLLLFVSWAVVGVVAVGDYPAVAKTFRLETIRLALTFRIARGLWALIATVLSFLPAAAVQDPSVGGGMITSDVPAFLASTYTMLVFLLAFDVLGHVLLSRSILLRKKNSAEARQGKGEPGTR
jgi:hypothetical protein